MESFGSCQVVHCIGTTSSTSSSVKAKPKAYTRLSFQQVGKVSCTSTKILLAPLPFICQASLMTYWLQAVVIRQWLSSDHPSRHEHNNCTATEEQCFLRSVLRCYKQGELARSVRQWS
jgi:hypothetical protein